MNVEVVELDTTIPFTAARARNAGVERLRQLAPDTTYVQFVDGDCEINPAWWSVASNRLDQRPDLAAVCGRRRERFPDASRYNKMCDLEWDTPIGDTTECGGDSMMRLAHFTAVNGFDATLIAGEEPELCLRLRQRGWRIERLDAEMTLHDAAMTRFSQWWRREKRSGYAFAEAAHRFGHTPERFRVRWVQRNWLYGLIIPLLALALAYWTYGWSLLLLLAYPLQWLKVHRYCRRSRKLTGPDARLYATLVVLAKFPQMAGQVKFLLGRWTRNPSRLIEYKSAERTTSSSTPA
jgi:GT2 family glycosyltransferase